MTSGPRSAVMKRWQPLRAGRKNRPRLVPPLRPACLTTAKGGTRPRPALASVPAEPRRDDRNSGRVAIFTTPNLFPKPPPPPGFGTRFARLQRPQRSGGRPGGRARDVTDVKRLARLVPAGVLAATWLPCEVPPRGTEHFPHGGDPANPARCAAKRNTARLMLGDAARSRERGTVQGQGGGWRSAITEDVEATLEPTRLRSNERGEDGAPLIPDEVGTQPRPAPPQPRGRARPVAKRRGLRLRLA